MRQEKDRIRARELFRQMTPKEKLRHIWEYERIPALCAILLTVAVISFVAAAVNGARTKGNLHVVLLGVREELGAAVEQLADEAGWDKGLTLTTGPGIGSDSDISSAEGMVQIVCLLTADEMDIAICDRATADYIQQDEEIPVRLYPIEETKLSEFALKSRELFVLVFDQIERADEAQEFARLLGCE